MKRILSEKILYKNSKGKIIEYFDYFDGQIFALFDNEGNFIKMLPSEFSVSDYL